MYAAFLMIAAKEHMSEDNDNVCMYVTVMGHYFVLTSLSWMLVEALHMHELLIVIFASTEIKFIIKRMTIAWGKDIHTVSLARQYSTRFRLDV